MPVAVVPNQMFQHVFEPLKGWPSQTAVDMSFKLDAATDATCLPYGGRIVHVNSNVVNGKKVDQVARLGAIGTQVAITLIQGQGDYDVANPGNGTTDPYGWTAVSPAGYGSGLVHTGAYELATTEFDQTAGTVYAPGDLLHSPTETQITGSDKSTAGLLFKTRNWPGGNAGAVTQFVDNVCGVVSRGQTQNHFRRQVLSFWPCWLPGQDATH